MLSKRTILALAALAVIVCATGAFGYDDDDDDDDPKDWCRGPQKNFIKPEAPAKWSKQNDEICKNSCSGSYPRYKKGNWGLFHNDGLVCCCAARNLGFNNKYRDYDEQEPFISWDAMEATGLYSDSPLQD